MNPVEPEEIGAFITYLRSLGFATGAGERVRALRLYTALSREQRGLRLKSTLAPVFARDADEQHRFYRAFDLFFRPPAFSSALGVEAGQAVKAPSTGRPSKGARRLWLARLGVAAIATIAAIALFGLLLRIPPTNLPVSPRIGDWVRQTVTLPGTSSRPCAGWECLTTGWRPWVLAAPLVMWLAWHLVTRTSGFRRRSAALRERRLTPPFEWPLQVEAPPLAPIVQGASQAAAAELAKRLAAETEQLDVLATVYETARQGGFPQPRFAWRRQIPEYLVLIEEQSRADHFAAWLDGVVVNLAGRGVRLERYHYRDVPQVCFRPGSSMEVPFRQLLRKYPTHRVLLFGEAHALSDPYSGRLAPWAREIQEHDARAWLTPMAPFEWRTPERRAAQWIRLVPARLSQLIELSKGFEAPSAVTSIRHSFADEYPLPPADLLAEDSEPDVLQLSAFLDRDVFAWLCACALHNELNWPLTCRLALAISPDGALLNERPTLQLIRLPWFRSGRIPAGWRTALVKCLAPADARRAREELLSWLEPNKAPDGSFARRVQIAQIAAHRYYLEPTDPKRRALAAVALSRMAQADVEADTLLLQLESDLRARDRVPSGMQLRTSYYLLRYSALVSTALAAASMAGIFTIVTRVPIQDIRTIQETRYVYRDSLPPPSLPTMPDSAKGSTTQPPSDEAGRQAQLKTEADRQAQLKTEADRQAQLKTEVDRQAQLKTEADRQAQLKTEADRQAQLKAEADRVALEAEAGRKTLPSPVPAPSAPRKDESEVLSVLNRYAAAYSQLEVDAIRSVWPTLPSDLAEQFGRSFSQVRSYQMRLTDCAVSVQDSTATARCQGTASIVPKVGRAPSPAQFSSTFVLRKVAELWVIDKVTEAKK